MDYATKGQFAQNLKERFGQPADALLTLSTRLTFSVRSLIIVGIWLGLSFVLPFIPGIPRDQYGYFAHHQRVLVPYAFILWSCFKIFIPELEGELTDWIAGYLRGWQIKRR